MSFSEADRQLFEYMLAMRRRRADAARGRYASDESVRERSKANYLKRRDILLAKLSEQRAVERAEKEAAGIPIRKRGRPSKSATETANPGAFV